MTSRRCLWLRLKSWQSQSWESFSGAIDCTARVSRNISKGTLESKSGWEPVPLEFQQKHTNAIWCNLWAHFWLQHLTSEPWQNQARHLYKSCTSLYTLHIGEKYDTTSCDALARHQLHLHLRTPATQHFHITMWRVTLHGTCGCCWWWWKGGGMQLQVWKIKDIQVLDALLIELNELLEKANAANSNWKDMWLQSSVCILKSPFAKVCRFIELPKTNIYIIWCFDRKLMCH